MLIEFLRNYSSYAEELTLYEASTLTGYPVHTLRMAMKDGELSFFRIGHRYLVPKMSLKSYVLQRLHISEQDVELQVLAANDDDSTLKGEG